MGSRPLQCLARRLLLGRAATLKTLLHKQSRAYPDKNSYH